MSMKQNCPRPKKKLSRIILPDDDSEEELSTVNDRDHPSAHGGTADKHTQQGQQGGSGPPGSSAQPQVPPNSPVNQNPKQRHQVVQSQKAAIPEVANLKARRHHTMPSTSSPCVKAESKKECGKHPAELKVCMKTKQNKLLGAGVLSFLYFILNNSKTKVVLCFNFLKWSPPGVSWPPASLEDP